MKRKEEKTREKPAMVVYTCELNMWEAGTRGSPIQATWEFKVSLYLKANMVPVRRLSGLKLPAI